MTTKNSSVRDRASLPISIPAPTTKIASGTLSKPATGVGVMMQHLVDSSEVHKENEVLKNEAQNWNGANVAKLLDTNSIVPSKWANRISQSFSGSEFDELKKDIDEAGRNVQPIKVNPIAGTNPQKYEIVFGHRRHRACSELGIQVFAVIDSMDDKTLFSEMDRENRQRADLRPYEQGVMYARALDEGLFPSARKLGEVLGVDAGNLSKLLSLGRLPLPLVNAFESPLDLQQNWATALTSALERNPELCLQRAQMLSQTTPRLRAKEVFALLTSSNVVSDNPPAANGNKSLMSAGKSVAKVLSKDGQVTVKFEKNVLSDVQLKQVERFIERILES